MIQQDRVIRQRTDRMHIHLDAQFSLQLFMNVAGYSMQIPFRQQVGLANEHDGRNSAFIKQAQGSNVFFIQSRFHQHDALLEAGRRNLDHGPRHIAQIARISLFRDQPGKLFDGDGFFSPVPVGHGGAQPRPVAQFRRHRGDRIDAHR